MLEDIIVNLFGGLDIDVLIWSFISIGLSITISLIGFLLLVKMTFFNKHVAIILPLIILLNSMSFGLFALSFYMQSSKYDCKITDIKEFEYELKEENMAIHVNRVEVCRSRHTIGDDFSEWTSITLFFEEE